MNYNKSILLGIIEGITEFFPVSSTGHMIIISSIMGIIQDKIFNFFLVIVQLGAILSVIFLYRKKIFSQKLSFYIKIMISIIPIGIVGFLAQKNINYLLKNPFIVAISLLVGGIVILMSERKYEKNLLIKKKKKRISYYTAFIIGIFQCFSLIPGVSRSASTIIACLLQNVDRKDSIEYSLFLSIPVISIAACKKLFEYFTHLDYYSCDFFFDKIDLFLVGVLTAFITSIISIKYFIKFIKKNSFKVFGYYRIIIGILFILYYYTIK